ncbi:MAG: hypothetical protein JRI39_02790 [Deltaproteobacteria bacterium]|nr:hypothetical protein [Deltaproteobacteria bacterium]MBW2082029.1 hypothetical protein [Deltaproteobacteria bacterium]HDM10674.1 hypothetical protein [Desulfobacteraceae bacterium]
MKLKTGIVAWSLVVGLLLLPAFGVLAEGKPKLFIPDKALCAKMLRFGKEAYMRGKYLDAKEYFRKAIQADPTSQTAWRYYDQAVIFGLAERVEKDAGLLLPGKSIRAEQPAPAGTQATPPQTTTSEEKKEPEFKIVEDEGC